MGPTLAKNGLALRKLQLTVLTHTVHIVRDSFTRHGLPDDNLGCVGPVFHCEAKVLRSTDSTDATDVLKLLLLPMFGRPCYPFRPPSLPASSSTSAARARHLHRSCSARYVNTGQAQVIADCACVRFMAMLRLGGRSAAAVEGRAGGDRGLRTQHGRLNVCSKRGARISAAFA